MGFKVPRRSLILQVSPIDVDLSSSLSKSLMADIGDGLSQAPTCVSDGALSLGIDARRHQVKTTESKLETVQADNARSTEALQAFESAYQNAAHPNEIIQRKASADLNIGDDPVIVRIVKEFSLSRSSTPAIIPSSSAATTACDELELPHKSSTELNSEEERTLEEIEREFSLSNPGTPALPVNEERCSRSTPPLNAESPLPFAMPFAARVAEVAFEVPEIPRSKSSDEVVAADETKIEEISKEFGLSQPNTPSHGLNELRNFAMESEEQVLPRKASTEFNAAEERLIDEISREFSISPAGSPTADVAELSFSTVA